MQELKPPFYLTEELRKTFKGHIGELIQDSGFSALCDLLRITDFPIASVGDTTTLKLIARGIRPDLVIVDLGTRRGALSNKDMERMEIFLVSSTPVLEIENPPGEITTELWEPIRDFYNKFKIGRPERKGTAPLIIKIIGEEDLASLPCIYFSYPAGHVLFGLPDKGLVHIQVNETHRTIVYDALKKMEALNGPQGNKSG